VRQVQLGLKSPKNAVAIAQGGLDYWYCVLLSNRCLCFPPSFRPHPTPSPHSYKNFEFIRDGQTYKLGEALDKFTSHSYETGVIKGSGSLPKFGPVVKVRACVRGMRGVPFVRGRRQHS